MDSAEQESLADHRDGKSASTSPGPQTFIFPTAANPVILHWEC